MNLDFKPAPIEQTFRDVSPNTFYKDYQGDLMLKVNASSALRIAAPDGKVDARYFTPAPHTRVLEIYTVDKINF